MSFSDLPGWVENRNGRASSRWEYQGANKRRTHPIPFHRDNRKIIHTLHRQFVNDLIAETYSPRSKAPASVYGAIQEFFLATGQAMTAAARRSYDTAFSYYFHRDINLSEEVIEKHLATLQSAPPPGRNLIAPTTNGKYMQRVNRFLSWCVTKEYLKRNPAKTIDLPTPRRIRNTSIFTPEEVGRMVTYHRRRAEEIEHGRYGISHVYQALFIELTYLIGTRPSELIRLKWEDVSPSSILIHGKAAPTKENSRTKKDFLTPRACRDENARIRHFPLSDLSRLTGAKLEWQTQIREALDELRALPQQWGGWVFRIKQTQTANKGLKEARDSLWETEVERKVDTRVFRNLRYSTRWYYENVLRLDPILIADLLGHSPWTSFKHYRERPNPADISERIVNG